MPDYEEEHDQMEVPRAVGIAGYLKVIQGLLELPRVQEIVVKAGVVSWRRFRKPDEPHRELGVDLDTLLPSSVIRSRSVIELQPVVESAAVTVAQMFAQVHMDGFNPVSFVGGQASNFFSWHARTTGVMLAKTEMYGLPFLLDNQIPDEALILCAAYGRRAALVDTVQSYKVTIPWSTK